jgi:triosephosphate isomerase (TIM)
MHTKETLVVANWKMNPQTLGAAKELATETKKALSRVKQTTVVIAPPTLYIPIVAPIFGKTLLLLGAQNAHWEKLGAHTGETSLPMLKGLGVSYLIVGHSERRKDGETNTMVSAKIAAALKQGMQVIVCVGERERDHGAQYLSFIEEQVRAACAVVPKAKLGQCVIAYEPIWAIGTGTNATPADVYEMRLFIEKILTDIYGRTSAQKVRVLYGGSVSGKNAADIVRDGKIDGFLVGGASLNAREFTSIVHAVAQAHTV